MIDRALWRFGNLSLWQCGALRPKARAGERQCVVEHCQVSENGSTCSPRSSHWLALGRTIRLRGRRTALRINDVGLSRRMKHRCWGFAGTERLTHSSVCFRSLCDRQGDFLHCWNHGARTTGSRNTVTGLADENRMGRQCAGPRTQSSCWRQLPDVSSSSKWLKAAASTMIITTRRPTQGRRAEGACLTDVSLCGRGSVMPEYPPLRIRIVRSLAVALT